eukprot:GILI01013013.1.p1 GENE.GILI01013013.1~~GILI01013013.1.p1  ORF type:complete len:256 (-),score=34.65 GILI01013013.1:89-856(-)
MSTIEYDSSHCDHTGTGLCFHKQFNPFVELHVIAGCHIAYIVIIFGIRALMKNRKPFECKTAMLVYNFIQVVASVTMTVGLAPNLLNYFFNLNGKFNESIEFWIFVHYITKYLDMFDSLFMVLRKKDEQLSFLHVYHHLTIGAIWGVLLNFGYANGCASFGSWINSLVHSLMYFHYFWTSLKFKNPFKAYLTQFQMLQFGLCITQSVLSVLFDQQFPLLWTGLQCVYHMSLLYLFMQFYRKDRKKDSKRLVEKSK